MNAPLAMKTKRNPTVVIVGAGMTGMLMAIKLREAGINDLHIFEKKDKIGGTWRENTYPGVACDVPSHMYTYSFETNPNWSHLYAHGDEIQSYFEGVADKYGLNSLINFNESVTDSVYDNGKWTVTTSKGATVVADFLINCTGILHHPAMPNIKGLDSFTGEKFHTAQWNHEVELEGKRIGVIGTGSTAAQVIPEVAKLAGKLNVFQRTPHWLIPMGNKSYSEQEKAKLKASPKRLWKLRRRYEWNMQNLFTKAVTGHQPHRFIFSLICKLYLRFGVKDKALRKKLTPDYAVGCKRIIVNTTFYPALQRDNVELVSDGIKEITETGVTTVDGKHHELDVLVFATGFHPFSFMRPMNMVGKNGLHINDAWSKKIRAYRSLFIPQFPNSFLMLGPNTPIGNYSVIAMSEVQCAYIIKLISRWQQGEYDEIDVSPTAVDRFAKTMKEGMQNTVWVGGCQSWYLDDDGDPALWPFTWQRWEQEMQEPEMGDFELSRNQVEAVA